MTVDHLLLQQAFSLFSECEAERSHEEEPPYQAKFRIMYEKVASANQETKKALSDRLLTRGNKELASYLQKIHLRNLW